MTIAKEMQRYAIRVRQVVIREVVVMASSVRQAREWAAKPWEAPVGALSDWSDPGASHTTAYPIAAIADHAPAAGAHQLSPADQDTFRMVRAFGAALADKLARAELKYGYSNGWLTEDWAAECRQHLREHLEKGDPLDVAAYAAFCWARGWSTSNAQDGDAAGVVLAPAGRSAYAARHARKHAMRQAAQTAGESSREDHKPLPPQEDDGSLACTEIAMGHGLVDVGEFQLGERRGILLRPREHHIPVGEDGELQNVVYYPVTGDVVIWIDDPKGAQVIIDQLQPFAPQEDDATGTGAEEPPAYMGTAGAAREALMAAAQKWRAYRQPLIAAPETHRRREMSEQEARFQLANAAVLWLWHEEFAGAPKGVAS